MQVELQPKRQTASVADTDAFCGPCFHIAMNHNGFDSTATLCWECPGSKSDYNENPSSWWDRPDGDPTLEGYVCSLCSSDRQPCSGVVYCEEEDA